MDEDRVRLVSTGLVLLYLVCAVGFLSFVSTRRGAPPRWPGYAFVLTGIYSAVFFRPLTISARTSHYESESRPLVETAAFGFPTSWVPPSLAPWLQAVVFVGFGVAMLLY